MFFTTKSKSDRAEEINGYIETDFHSHILPCVDDGSKSVEQSLEMLCRSRKQGVKRIVATPHFYPDLTNPELFLEDRRIGVEKLVSAVSENCSSEDVPRVYLGAEVAFFNGISRCAWMKKLCVANSSLLLVEMPFERWNEKVLNELFEIKSNLGLTVVVAHVERYFSLQSRDIINELFDQDVLIQCNAEAFLKRKTCKKVLGMLEDGRIDFIGSDCHNLDTRAPNIGEAGKIISQKLGEEPLDDLNKSCDLFFADVDPIF